MTHSIPDPFKETFLKFVLVYAVSDSNNLTVLIKKKKK